MWVIYTTLYHIYSDRRALHNFGPSVTFKLRVENAYIVEIYLFMNRNLVFVVSMGKEYNIIAINSEYNIISSTFNLTAVIIVEVRIFIGTKFIYFLRFKLLRAINSLEGPLGIQKSMSSYHVSEIRLSVNEKSPFSKYAATTMLLGLFPIFDRLVHKSLIIHICIWIFYPRR